jgi:hypothetical protein
MYTILYGKNRLSCAPCHHPEERIIMPYRVKMPARANRLAVDGSQESQPLPRTKATKASAAAYIQTREFCHSFLSFVFHIDFPYKRELERENDRRPSSKPAAGIWIHLGPPPSSPPAISASMADSRTAVARGTSWRCPSALTSVREERGAL